jgi:hypothetical protein
MGDRAPGPGRRNAHRCAPQTDHVHGPPVGANRTACKKLSQLKEVNSTSAERTTLELQLCGAAVHASLAPAQPLLQLGWPACMSRA